jgi:glycosyltransferase involved in cell wall biosynthesis
MHQVCREIWWREVPLPIAVLGRFVFEPKWLLPYRDVPTVTLSEASKKSLERYGLRRVWTVSPGFSEKVPLASQKEQRLTLLYVGRLVSSKRPHHVLRAFAEVRRAVPSAQLWFVGDGPLKVKLQRRAPDGVEFFGRVDEQKKRELMAAAHVLVMCSVREGWGLTVTEAALAGTPTVGYDVDGLGESIRAAAGAVSHTSPKDLARTILDACAGWLRQPYVPPMDLGVQPWADVAKALLEVVHMGGSLTMRGSESSCCEAAGEQ